MITTRKPTTRKRKRTPEQRAARTRTILRMLAILGGLPVFGVALYVSYGHIHHVTLRGGESQTTANIMALSVDGMMLVATVAILAGYRTLSAYAAFILGCLASLGANVISATDTGTPLAYIVAGWPAVTMVLTSEVLARLFLPARPKRRKPVKRTVSAPARRAVNPVPVPATA